MLRPKYKVGYKTVSDLAWRCCPGLTGEGCPEHLQGHGATPSQLEPEPPIPSGELGPGPRPPSPGRVAPSLHGESLVGEDFPSMGGQNREHIAQAGAQGKSPGPKVEATILEQELPMART